MMAAWATTTWDPWERGTWLLPSLCATTSFKSGTKRTVVSVAAFMCLTCTSVCDPTSWATKGHGVWASAWRNVLNSRKSGTRLLHRLVRGCAVHITATTGLHEGWAEAAAFPTTTWALWGRATCGLGWHSVHS
jgi:hypothetical protein